MQTSELTIRFIQYQELELVTSLGQKFFNEGFLIGKLKPEVFTTTWTNIITSGNGAIIGAFREGRFIGMLGFVISADPNDGQLVSQEMFWFVDPRYRKGEGIKLLNKYEEVAAQIGVKRIGMAHLQSDNNTTLAKLFNKRGYKAIETHYMKEIS